MNKLIFLLLIIHAMIIGEQITIYTPEYIPQNSITAHIVASGKEISASFKKMSVHIKEGEVRDKDKPAVLLIHGLNSSPKDWHMLFHDLKKEGFEVYTIYVSYWKKGGFTKSVKQIQHKIRNILELHPNLSVMGHSLGGVAAVDAVNQLGETKQKVTRVITVNSPLNGTTVLNSFTSIFIPDHLVEVLTFAGPFVKKLQEEAVKTKQVGVRFYHTACESDHLVREIDTCFLPDYDEAIVVTGEGHLSTLNSIFVRNKIIEWLKN